jgi:manganese transport protein
VLTCAAETGGVAILLRLILGIPYGTGIAVAIAVMIAVISFLDFEKLERLFGLMGLFMLVFVAAALALGVDWAQAAGGLVPHGPGGSASVPSYLYFAVGLIAATIMPYEVQFYSSGNIEEDLKPEDLGTNTLTSVVGIGFGAVVTIAIIVVGAQVLGPLGVIPERLGASMLGPMAAFGVAGLLAALLGSLFAVAGASAETSLSGAYAIAQFFGFEWGKSRSPWHVPQFSLSWLMILGMSALILATGIDPIQVTEYAVIFSVIVLPLTYLPILLVARDRALMGEHVNSRLQDVLGVVAFVLIAVVAVAAVPLMYLSRMGQA